MLARCLHVPVSAVDGAFGMGNSVSQRTAEAISPSYADPAGNGGAVSSVVDVVQSPQIEATADATVFQDPALFATCYQPFVQAMLPYASGGGTTGFATATVQPVVVPVPAGPGAVTVAGFQIARIANDDGSDQDRRLHRHRRVRRPCAGHARDGQQPRLLTRRPEPARATTSRSGPSAWASCEAPAVRVQPGVRRPMVHNAR